MRSVPTIGLYLNKEYSNKNGLFPVKIRVTYRRQSKFYKTKFHLSVEDFEKSYCKTRPQGKYVLLKDNLLEVENKAKSIVSKLLEFSFDEFRAIYFGEIVLSNNVYDYYQAKINQHCNREKYSTMESYQLSRRKIMDFFTGSQKSGFLSFDMISPRNLEKFDKWMHDQGYSKTTTGIYLRCLRCVFNDAIRSGAIHPKKYPFGQRKYGLYAIPRGYNIKKALSEEQIKLIKGHSIQPGTKEAMARDFWMLSFYCAGINLSDLLRLRNKDFDGGAIKFVRRKTRDSLLKVEPTEVLLVKDGIDIIERYRSAKKSDNAYLFEVVDSSKPEAIQRKQIKNFNRSLDYGLKRLAKSVKLEVKLSFYHARHSFANIALNKNVPLSYISDQLSHSSISTTKLYLKGISRSNKMKTVKTIFEGL